MRTIDEFKADRAQWNKDSDRKHAVRLVVGWCIAVVVILVLAGVGWQAYQSHKASDSAKTSDAATQSGNTNP